MQQEKDYILREIQRLTLLLTKLIGKALGLNPNEFEQETQNIESDLKTEFDLTLREISKMEDSVLLERIHKLNEEHLEKLAELICVLLNNKQTEYENRLAQKGIVILNFLDSKSKTFSFKRIELKNTLQQWL